MDIERLITMYPDKHWDFYHLTNKVSIEFIISHLDYEWMHPTNHPDITLDIIKTYFKNVAIAVDNLTENDIDILKKEMNLKKQIISSSSTLSFEYMLKNLELFFDEDYGICNCNDRFIDKNIIEKLIINKDDDYWYGLSQNKYLTIELMEHYIDELKFVYLSYNPNLNYEFVNKYLHRGWNFKGLVTNRALSVDDVIKLNIDRKYLIYNPNTTIDDVIKYNLDYIAYALHNHNLDILIEKNLKFDKINIGYFDVINFDPKYISYFDWNTINRNTRFPMTLVVENQELNWDYKLISQYFIPDEESIHILKNHIDFYKLSSNVHLINDKSVITYHYS